MMDLRKNGSLGLFLMLVHVIVSKVLAGRHGMDVGSFSGSNLDEQTVEQMLLDCGLDLIAIKEEVQQSGSYLSKENVLDSTEISPSAKGSIREALSLLTPEVNRSFLDCLIRQNFPLHNSGEDSLRIWFAGYLDSLGSQVPTARRHLANRPSEDLSPASTSAPPTDPNPNVGSVPSLLETASKLLPKKLPHLDPNRRPISQKLQDRNLAELPAPLPNNQGNINQTIIIAVTLTAAVTSICVALLFLCYFSCQRKNSYSGYSIRDDKPLLSLSFSDFSVSSHKSSGTPNGILAPPKPLKTDPSQSLLDDTPNSILAPPKPLKTDSSLSIQVSSLDNSVETQLSDVLPENSSFSTDNIPTDTPAHIITEPNNIPTDSLAPKPPPPPPPRALKPSPFQKPAPPPPGLPPPSRVGPRPPPPPKGVAPPSRAPPAKINFVRPNKAPPLAPKHLGGSVDDGNGPKTKLKPFFWDKVQAKPDQAMVWDQLKAGSFQFNEEMIESLFGYTENKEGKKILSSKDASSQYVRILDAKKSQNLSISLKAMSVKSEEVRDALMEGNELPAELLHMLLKMAPTTEEELKIRLYSNPSQLGPAEQFVRAIVDIPCAYQRIEALLFMTSLPEEALSISQSFSTLEVACTELRSSRLFLKLLEAVLKTGNRMNDGTYRGGAQAFKLDTLLKLADVRGTDGKTTLLNFVVLEIIRAEGVRAVRTARESRSSISSLTSEDLFEDLPSESGDHYRCLGLDVVSGLSGELENVKKAAGLDADALTNTVASLGERLLKTRDFLKTKMEGCDEESQFLQSLRGFVQHAEADITSLLVEEKRIRLLVKETTDYFHGNSGKDEGLRLFVIVRDFLGMIDKVCKEVKVLPKSTPKTQKTRAMLPAMSPARDPRQLLFPAVKDRCMDSSSSSSSDEDN